MTSTDSTRQALAQLAHAAVLIESATTAIAADEPAPGHAAYYAWLVEQAGRRLTRAQIHAADALRRSGAHQLDEESHQAIADAGLHPSAADLEATRGRLTAGRSYHKDTLGLMKERLNLSTAVAKSRLIHAESLIAQVNDAGERLAPRYRQLAEEFQRPDSEPGLVLGAATQLRKAEPDLAQAPDPAAARAGLEADAIALIRHEPSTARRHLTRMIEQQAGENRPLAALLAEVGLYRSGMRRGLVHYRLSMLPQDAELIESMCAQIDNPQGIAGNRAELRRLVLQQYLAASGPGEATPEAAPQPEWGQAETMPEWAAPEAAQEPSGSRDVDDPAGVAGVPDDAHAIRGPEECPPDPDPGKLDVPPAQATRTAPGAADPPAAPSRQGERAGHDLPEELQLPFEELRPEFRHLTALVGILKSAGDGGKQSGLVQPQVTVILDYFKMMEAGRNFAVTEGGLPLAAGAARTMMCNGRILPVVLGANSQVLDIGRESRFFRNHQRRALQARYRGCAYPGCTMPASRCEADHIQAWEDGGVTSVENGMLLCPMHHHARHCGLFKVIANEDGPPMILLPKNLDPHQRPRLNTYWHSPSEAIDAARNAQAGPGAA